MSNTAPTYETVTKALEGSFEEFVRNPEVNAYLQTIGPKITHKVMQDGVENEFTIVSGYEKKRGKWATAYGHKLRFGDEIYKVRFGLHDRLANPMILTPNFFYGENKDGEELEYRMGLIKGKNTVEVLPVILKKNENQISAEVLADLCVIHNGLFIDPETAEQIGQKRVGELTAYQQFLTCLWNIDDYIRKQNQDWESDFEDADVWKGVEVFSGRIVDQMLRKIACELSALPRWMLPQAEDVYREKLVSQIESCMDVGNDVSENQMITLARNLCSYMKRFKNYQPLEELAEKDLNIILYIVRNFRSPEKEVRKEALQAYQSVLEKTPQIIEQALPTIIDMFSDKDWDVRFKALKAYRSVINKTPQIINQKGVDEVITMLSDQESGVRSRALSAYRVVINKTPQIIIQKVVEKVIDMLSDQESAVRSRALLAYTSVIDKTPQFITREGDDKVIDMFSDPDKDVTHWALLAYTSVIDKTPEFIEQEGVNKIITTLSDPNKYVRSQAFRAYELLVKKRPDLIEP
jgi:hypothetical protein